MRFVPEFQRRGIGRALAVCAEEWLRARGIGYLAVKTLGLSVPDLHYERTRMFYEALGFVPREGFPLLWNAEDPCLFMVKALGLDRKSGGVRT